jgi:Peptidase S24-like
LPARELRRSVQSVLARMQNASAEFAHYPEAWDLLLQQGGPVFRIRSTSMAPVLRPADTIILEPVPSEALKAGDLVVVKILDALVCHRYQGPVERNGETCLLTKGDAEMTADVPVKRCDLVGRVREIHRAAFWSQIFWRMTWGFSRWKAQASILSRVRQRPVK